MKKIISTFVILVTSSCWPQKEILTGYRPQNIAPPGVAQPQLIENECSERFTSEMSLAEIAMTAYEIQKQCDLSNEEVVIQAEATF